jgi:hypothetical protein
MAALPAILRRASYITIIPNYPHHLHYLAENGRRSRRALHTCVSALAASLREHENAARISAP